MCVNTNLLCRSWELCSVNNSWLLKLIIPCSQYVLSVLPSLRCRKHLSYPCSCCWDCGSPCCAILRWYPAAKSFRFSACPSLSPKWFSNTSKNHWYYSYSLQWKVRDWIEWVFELGDTEMSGVVEYSFVSFDLIHALRIVGSGKPNICHNSPSRRSNIKLRELTFKNKTAPEASSTVRLRLGLSPLGSSKSRRNDSSGIWRMESWRPSLCGTSGKIWTEAIKR